MQSNLEIKIKYQRMMNMLKGKQDSEEKIKLLEEKKRKDEQEMLQDLNETKARRTQEIKDIYNKQSGEVRISFEAVRDAMRIWG